MHTTESMDAVVFGTQATIEDAYKFAQGMPLRSPGGELMQLSRPLDFVAVTDHAEGFGRQTRLAAEPNMEQPAGVYLNRTRPQKSDVTICRLGEGGLERCRLDSMSDWARYIDLANQFYEPGKFTTFAAYEFSPVLEGAGKHHRNVIFNGDELPEIAISATDVNNAIDLWRGLDETCVGDCDFLTIPHNMNTGWGLFYSRNTYDGGTYDEEGWRLRQRREPLAEMYQVKGASECVLGVGATDEECAFEQVLEPCEVRQATGCALESSFVRQGLKIGMQLEDELGFNPLAFGFVAATDMHNSNLGDAEEWDFPGKVGALSSPALRRMRMQPDSPKSSQILTDRGSGGLAAVWATENTRDAIFNGMQNREAYGTSGPRILLRFFAGSDFDQSIVGSSDPISVATNGGVPMGGVLGAEPNRESLTFFVSAGADPMSALLQRVQVVKSWIDSEGETHEIVNDVICADGLEVDPDTGRCPDNDASFDVATCQLRGEGGAGQLVTTWQDIDFYDAIRLSRQPDPQVPATIRERARSSPIWIDPQTRDEEDD